MVIPVEGVGCLAMAMSWLQMNSWNFLPDSWACRWIFCLISRGKLSKAVKHFETIEFILSYIFSLISPSSSGEDWLLLYASGANRPSSLILRVIFFFKNESFSSCNLVSSSIWLHFSSSCLHFSFSNLKFFVIDSQWLQNSILLTKTDELVKSCLLDSEIKTWGPNKSMTTFMASSNE